MKKVLSALAAIVITIFLAGCSNSEDEYSTEACYFYFNFTNHPASIIQNALTGVNSFVRVHSGYRSTASGARVLHLYASMFGSTSEEDNTITAEPELRRPYVLGIYNLLYIGWSTGDNALMAYDGQCPNCYAQTGLTRYPLEWSHSGLYLRCPNCKREYDLNNRGFVVDGDGSPLRRYIATAGGGILLVHNAQ